MVGGAIAASGEKGVAEQHEGKEAPDGGASHPHEDAGTALRIPTRWWIAALSLGVVATAFGVGLRLQGAAAARARLLHEVHGHLDRGQPAAARQTLSEGGAAGALVPADEADPDVAWALGRLLAAEGDRGAGARLLAQAAVADDEWTLEQRLAIALHRAEVALAAGADADAVAVLEPALSRGADALDDHLDRDDLGLDGQATPHLAPDAGAPEAGRMFTLLQARVEAGRQLAGKAIAEGRGADALVALHDADAAVRGRICTGTHRIACRGVRASVHAYLTRRLARELALAHVSDAAARGEAAERAGDFAEAAKAFGEALQALQQTTAVDKRPGTPAPATAAAIEDAQAGAAALAARQRRAAAVAAGLDATSGALDALAELGARKVGLVDADRLALRQRLAARPLVAETWLAPALQALASSRAPGRDAEAAAADRALTRIFLDAAVAIAEAESVLAATAAPPALAVVVGRERDSRPNPQPASAPTPSRQAHSAAGARARLWRGVLDLLEGRLAPTAAATAMRAAWAAGANGPAEARVLALALDVAGADANAEAWLAIGLPTEASHTADPDAALRGALALCGDGATERCAAVTAMMRARFGGRTQVDVAEAALALQRGDVAAFARARVALDGDATGRAPAAVRGQQVAAATLDRHRDAVRAALLPGEVVLDAVFGHAALPAAGPVVVRERLPCVVLLFTDRRLLALRWIAERDQVVVLRQGSALLRRGVHMGGRLSLAAATGELGALGPVVEALRALVPKLGGDVAPAPDTAATPTPADLVDEGAALVVASLDLLEALRADLALLPAETALQVVEPRQILAHSLHTIDEEPGRLLLRLRTADGAGAFASGHLAWVLHHGQPELLRQLWRRALRPPPAAAPLAAPPSAPPTPGTDAPPAQPQAPAAVAPHRPAP